MKTQLNVLLLVLLGISYASYFSIANAQSSISLHNVKVPDGDISPGQMLTVFYDISNPNESVPIGLGLTLIESGKDRKIHDSENDMMVVSHKGIHTYARYFLLPSDLRLGTYDLNFTIWSGFPEKSKLIDYNNRIETLNVVNGQPEKQLFLDNFESYTIGIFPNKNWNLTFSELPLQQMVVNDISQSYSKSLRLKSQPATNDTAAYSSIATFPIHTDARYLGYEYSIWIDEQKPIPAYEHPGFFARYAKQYGAWYAQAKFRHDLKSIDSESNNSIAYWEPKEWIRVKALLDRKEYRYDLWINGEKEKIHRLDSHDPEKIDSFAIASDHPGVYVYYDDVRIFEWSNERIHVPGYNPPSVWEQTLQEIYYSANDLFLKNPFLAFILGTIVGFFANLASFRLIKRRIRHKQI